MGLSFPDWAEASCWEFGLEGIPFFKIVTLMAVVVTIGSGLLGDVTPGLTFPLSDSKAEET